MELPPGFEDMMAMWREAERDVVKSAMKARIRQMLSEGEAAGVLSHTAMQSYPGLFQIRDRPTAWSLVTISAKDDVCPVQFIERMKALLTKKGLEYVEQTEYVLEQRSEGEQQAPYGWHIHQLVKWSKPMAKSQRARLIYQCFGKYLAGQNYVDIKPVPDDRLVQIQAYLRGEKQASKMAKVERDRKLRRDLEIPDIFVEVHR